MSAAKSPIPDNIEEEYYQIAKAILESFPKYRPPLDLFEFREDVARLQSFCRKGDRLSNENVERVHELCAEGNLFVSRADHPIYSKHIIKQLDLVLVDRHLKDGEVADVITRALGIKAEEFFEQPVKPAFETLYKDILVFTEYLWADKHRTRLFMRRLNRDHTLANHSVNTLLVGMWLLLETKKETSRRELDKCALALLLHDLGMAKLPPFLLTKAGPLKLDERDKIVTHPLLGAKTIHKIGFAFEEMKQAMLEHHERLDGSGYPQKTTGDHISKFGKLVAVADSFSAMITKRNYAESIEPQQAAAMLLQDKKRYDEKYTSALNTAYVTGVFEIRGRS